MTAGAETPSVGPRWPRVVSPGDVQLVETERGRTLVHFAIAETETERTVCRQVDYDPASVRAFNFPPAIDPDDGSDS